MERDALSRATVPGRAVCTTRARPARRSAQALCAYAKELTGCERRQGIEDVRHERPEVHHPIGWCTKKKKHSERQCCQILLEFDAPVHRDQGVVLTLHPPEKLAVPDARPATTDHRVDAVALQRCGEI